MLTIDGFGREWRMEDKGDGLSIYPEDQSFDNVKQEWNTLARCGKHLIRVDAHVHADAADEAPHVIHYSTCSGEHRIAECTADHAWLSMSDSPTVRFQAPTHMSNACAPTNVNWIPCVKWGTRSRMPLGWTRPTPVCATCGHDTDDSTKKTKTKVSHVEAVCDTQTTDTTHVDTACDTQTTNTTHVDTVCDTQTTDTTHVDTVCDTQTTDTSEVPPGDVTTALKECADDCLTGTDGKPLSYDTTADEYYETDGKSRDDRTIPSGTDTSPVVSPQEFIMEATPEEVQRIEEYLASCASKKRVSEIIDMGKACTAPARVEPPKSNPPRMLSQKPVFRNAPGLQWSRPSVSSLPRVIMKEKQTQSKGLKFRF